MLLPARPRPGSVIARAFALTVSAGPVWQSTGSAQAVVPLSVGARVSISVPDSTCRRPWRRCEGGAGLAGTLVRVTPDTLVVQFGPTAALAIPRVAGQHIYVRSGGSRIRSALSGALTYGALSGLILSQSDASNRSKVLTAGGFTLGGFAFGAILPTDRWQRVAP